MVGHDQIPVLPFERFQAEHVPADIAKYSMRQAVHPNPVACGTVQHDIAKFSERLERDKEFQNRHNENGNHPEYRIDKINGERKNAPELFEYGFSHYPPLGLRKRQAEMLGQTTGNYKKSAGFYKSFTNGEPSFRHVQAEKHTKK